MKKVIAVLNDNEYCLTTNTTAIKNNWYIAYDVTVVKEEKERPNFAEKDIVPAVGRVMYGVGLHAYRISTIKPRHICSMCDEKGSNRIEKKFYCNHHFKQLTVTQPISGTNTIPKRNAPCHCGSGKKYKHCCLVKDRHTPRHYFNSRYKQEEIKKQKTAQ